MGALLDVEAVIQELRRPALVCKPPSFLEVQAGYRPGWTLFSSFFLQAWAVVLLVFFGRLVMFHAPRMVTPPLEALTPPSHDILILPTLGGGVEGGGPAGGGTGLAAKASTALPAPARRGFAYPGPVPIISNPPRAKLGIQTILQPPLVNLPRLRRLVELPNIVQPPPPAAEGAKPKPMIVKGGQLALRSRPEAPVAAPKVTLPLASDKSLADVIESKPQLPHRAVPRPVEASEVSAISDKQAGLLVLNAVPPPPDVTGKISRAEARSLFAVAPTETTIIAEPSAGTKTGGIRAAAAGMGGRRELRAGDAVGELGSGGDAATHGSAAATGTGSGGHYGDAHGSGLNSVANTTGSGRGTSSGPGLGTGAVAVPGTGAGAGSAPGTGSFHGITIQGGQYGNNANLLARSQPPRRQASYRMTIESTAGSGGGLPDLGVFRNEKVYTVYLDMRDSDEDPAPSWTLQYAVLQPTPTPGDAPTRIEGTPTPPYATLKQVPQFDPDLLRRYGHRVIAMSAVLDTEGKLENISARQTPENQITGALIGALKDWIFEPARIDGRPVALKVLLGIRLAGTR